MDYRIDYDRIDVADIMTQVKMKVAERPPAPEAPVAGPAVVPDLPKIPVAGLAAPPPPRAARGWKRLLKKTARFLSRPYLPFLIPFYEWVKFGLNYEVNVRIDETATRLEKTREETAARIEKNREEITARTEKNREEIIIRLDEVATRLQATRDEIVTRLGTTRETIKLLHNLGHNLVLELTKLKVEEEALKSKVRLLEKELETLEKREKTIEKKVFE